MRSLICCAGCLRDQLANPVDREILDIATGIAFDEKSPLAARHLLMAAPPEMLVAIARDCGAVIDGRFACAAELKTVRFVACPYEIDLPLLICIRNLLSSKMSPTIQEIIRAAWALGFCHN